LRVVIGEALPDRGGADRRSSSIIASMWVWRPFRAAGSRWIFRVGELAFLIAGCAVQWPGSLLQALASAW
jgi:hypothetical protein